MMALPTSFIWGFVFSKFRKHGLRSASTNVSLLGAGLATAALFWIIPTPSILKAQSQYAALHQSAIKPKAPITLSGDIRLDVFREKTCGDICVVALFQDDVRSVTVNPQQWKTPSNNPLSPSALTKGARTYRLNHGDTCRHRESITPDIHPQSVKFKHNHNPREMTAYLVALSTDHCITGETAIERYDFLVLDKHAVIPRDKKTSVWSLAPSQTTVRLYEIRNHAGIVLARRQSTSITAPRRPLFIGPHGHGGPSPRFELGWARQPIGNSLRALRSTEIGELLATTTTLVQNFRAPPAQEHVVARLRDALSAALADPNLPPSHPVFKTLPTYTTALLQNDPLPNDIDVIRSAIRDHRMHEFWRAHDFSKAFNHDLSLFRTAIIDRIATNSDDEKRYFKNTQWPHISINAPRGIRLVISGRRCTIERSGSSHTRQCAYRAIGPIKAPAPRTAFWIFSPITRKHYSTCRRQHCEDPADEPWRRPIAKRLSAPEQGFADWGPRPKMHWLIWNN